MNLFLARACLTGCSEELECFQEGKYPLDVGGRGSLLDFLIFQLKMLEKHRPVATCVFPWIRCPFAPFFVFLLKSLENIQKTTVRN